MLLVKGRDRCTFAAWFDRGSAAAAETHIPRDTAVRTSTFGGLGGGPAVTGRPLTRAVDVLQLADDDVVAVELATAESSALRCLCAARMLRMRATIAWLWLRLARASLDAVVVAGGEDFDAGDDRTGGGAATTAGLCSAEDWTGSIDIEVWLAAT